MKFLFLLLCGGPIAAALARDPIVDHLRSTLLTEVSARQEARTVANGKFPLSTGAWYMTDKYAKQASGIELFANGTRVCAAGASCGYRLDEKLVPCLGVHFGRGTVTELGAGVGRYQQAVLSLGRVPAYTAYDGMPDIQTLTSGRVGWADLSVVQGTRILRSDHALSLEVAEHIPPQHEAMCKRLSLL